MRNLFFIVGFAIPVLSFAADATGNYHTGGGAGSVECPAFLAAMDRGKAAGLNTRGYFAEIGEFAMFTAGFQTAYNMQTPNTCDIFSGISLNQALAWSENWCRSNPLEKFGSSLPLLAKTVFQKRLTTCPR